MTGCTAYFEDQLALHSDTVQSGALHTQVK